MIQTRPWNSRPASRCPTIILFVAILSLVVSLESVHADPITYRVIGLDPGFPDRSTISLGLNESGFTAGQTATSSGSLQAATWTDHGIVHLLGSLQGEQGSSIATGISDTGWVTGTSIYHDGLTHAFRSSVHGGLEDLGTLEGGTWSQGLAINSAGEVVGYGNRFDGRVHAFKALGDGTIIDLGRLPGTSSSKASDINDNGVVVGTANGAFGVEQGFIVDSLGIHSIGAFPGGSSSIAKAINESGVVTGYASDASGRDRTFLFQDGSLSALGMPSGALGSYGFDINNLDHVVGKLVYSTGQRAYIWTREHSTLDLNYYLQDADGWILESATGINDRGQITGFGRYYGVQRGYLLDPIQFGQTIPEPSSLLMFLIATAGLVTGSFLLRLKKQ